MAPKSAPNDQDDLGENNVAASKADLRENLGRRGIFFAASTLARYIGFVHRTASARAEPDDFAAILARQHPLILAVWHGQFMLIPKINVGALPTKIVVAHHKDAEVIGRAFARFNVELIRGAGAGTRKKDRGGAGALRAAIKALKGGNSLCMTADVPPGPARQVGLGMITLARLSGRPILPAAMATKHYISLSNWSRMTINLPFSKLGVVLGEPIHVPRQTSDEELEDLRRQVEQALNDVTKRAYALAQGNPARATPPRALATITADGHKVAIGRRLRFYQQLTSWARPLAPTILKYRERQQKEDPKRRSERFGLATLGRPEGTLIWFHAASVGELNAVLPLIDALHEQRPDVGAIVTTGTVTSAKLAAVRLADGVIHQYVPLDARQYVARFLRHWMPDLAIFTESEIWPNLILETAACDTPLLLVNGRMSERSYNKWRRKSDMSAPLFSRFDTVLAQNEKLARWFSELGAAKTLAVGNLKVDSPPPPVNNETYAVLREAIGARPVFIAASTHIGEDEIIASVHKIAKQTIDNLLTILVPRHPQRGDAIEKMLESQGLSVARRSNDDPLDVHTDIYLADTIGELGTFYKIADVAFIGGSLIERGGQNPIEAIRHGASVLTGPHWTNFRDEYKALIAGGAVQEVKNGEDLAAALHVLFNDHMEIERRCESAEQALHKLSGALARTLDLILPLLPDKPQNSGQKDLRRAS